MKYNFYVFMILSFLVCACGKNAKNHTAERSDRNYLDSLEFMQRESYNPKEKLYVVSKISFDSTGADGLNWYTVEMKNSANQFYFTTETDETRKTNAFAIGDTVLIGTNEAGEYIKFK